ncbi:hypothetical protein [Paractinoplanes atraurantiacus]|uniref:DUF4386 family protein n=1 Tax=Paractinoplanes atraurantiacus TaxID=1036182 RepID=A0A285J7X7_9ACTN|nr:hypothetical protein [Actinoplanes atraurantiacus]SNY55446.1 hypothetical protein SAMN05421748_116143 [Actinoplanes atraurantiacus]
MTTDLSVHDRTWSRLERATGAVGLTSIVLIFVAVIPIGDGEPRNQATVEEAARYYREAGEAWRELAFGLFPVSLMVFLWFAAGLSLVLRRVEPGPPWRSTVALMSGVLLVAFGMVDTSSVAAAHRGDLIDPVLAAYAWDVGIFGFANAWLALGSFALASGLAARAGGFLPRWLAWLGIVSGALLVPARFMWSWEAVWIVPYLAMWVWMIITCVLLMRRRGASAER